jgi:flavodoxin
MKTLVAYYSLKGNNAYLAKQIAEGLQCDIEPIRPRLDAFFFFLLRLSLGIRKMKHAPEAYDRVILCGPVFVGKLIPPLRDFIQRYNGRVNNWVFITCCGSGFEQRDEKFGHGQVFKKVQELLGEKCSHCEAFPISLVVPAEKMKDPDAIMKTRLTEENMQGEIKTRLESLIGKMKNHSINQD